VEYKKQRNDKGNYIGIITGVLLLLGLGGCALTPYEEEFACEGTDDYGRCVSVAGAYEQAVTGEPQGYPITRDRDGEEQMLEAYGEGDEEMGGLSDAQRKKQSEWSRYVSYRAAMYQKMKKLITDPVTPMVKQPSVVRTLILNYETGGDGNPLFMHRFVYFFGDDPKWVLGQEQGQTTEGVVLPILNN